MVFRVLLALIGAAIITTGLLLGMEAVTSLFRQNDTARYYRITDILPRPDPGRPERPSPPPRQPAVPAAELELPDAEAPQDPSVEPAAPLPPLRPQLNAPEGSDEPD